MNRFSDLNMSGIDGQNVAARHEMVSRTQRVIRQRAASIHERRSRARSLWIPLGICSTLLVAIFYAAWVLLTQAELTPTGVPDANYQLFFMLLWSLPVTVAVLGLIWLQRSRKHGREEVR
jgi:hypothetical protein